MAIVTTQALNKVLSAAGFLRGHWNASSRVKGWGSQSEGFEVERRYDSKFIEHRPFAQQRSRRWKEVKTTTGYTITYSFGSRDHTSGAEYVAKVYEVVTRMNQALEQAGYTTTFDVKNNKIHIAA